MRRLEELPGSKETILRFVEENKKLWKPIEHKADTIYVNLSMVRFQAAWIIPKFLFAKGLEERTKCKVIVLTWRRNPLLTELIESYGFEHVVLNKLNNMHFGAFIQTVIKTGFFMLFDGSGEGLKKMRAEGIVIGTSLYEDILRTSPLSTLISARNRICCKKMLHLIWTFYSLYWLCKRRKPEFVICDDLAYHEGMFNKLFHKFGARVHNVSNSAEGDVVFLSEGRVLTRNQIMHKRIAGRIDCLGDESIQWSEQYLRERYAGNNGIAIDRGAFSGKKVITREEVESYIGLNSQKKNVVIMAHTFTDAVFNYGELYFRDYYDWTEKTLSMAAENDTVNWILKPHPTRKAYNEEKDSIEKMYERHKTSNIYWLNDEISAESIKDIADVIITIGGNAGGEFACEGIPAIIVGKPYYQGFGYTIEPKNMEEYRNCLKHVSEIEKLTQEQIVTAKKVFYLRYCEDDNSDLFNDELSRMIKKEYFSMVDQIAIQYFKGDRGTEKYNDRMFQLITEYMEKNDLRTSQYYLKGYEYGRTDEEPKQK